MVFVRMLYLLCIQVGLISVPPCEHEWMIHRLEALAYDYEFVEVAARCRCGKLIRYVCEPDLVVVYG